MQSRKGMDDICVSSEGYARHKQSWTLAPSATTDGLFMFATAFLHTRHTSGIAGTSVGRTASNTVLVLAIRIHPDHVISMPTSIADPKATPIQKQSPSSISVQGAHENVNDFARKPDVIQQKVMNAVWGCSICFRYCNLPLIPSSAARCLHHRCSKLASSLVSLNPESCFVA